MLSLILKQTSWSMFGSLFGFAMGFFVKIFLIRAVGTEAFGQYVLGQTVVSTVQVFIAFSVPQIMLRFIPGFLDNGTNKKQANSLASFSIQFVLLVGILAAIMVMIFNQKIAGLFNNGGPTLGYIILVSAGYIPLTLYLTTLNTAYRTLFKIKETVLYGTIILVAVRAVLTFLVFSFYDDISYFIYIELASLFLVLIIMTYKFDHSALKLFNKVKARSIVENANYKKFGLKMYFYALIGFGSGQAITIIMGVYLPINDIGTYAVLMTIAGLSAFLLPSLNSVFAPLISKLYVANEITKLELIFKNTTFVINIITTPFIVLLVIFSQDILALYGGDISNHSTLLTILILGGYINLFVGNSGMLLLMGGKDKIELWLKIINTTLVISASIFFIPKFGLIAAVIVNAVATISMNIMQACWVRKSFGFFPWDLSSFSLCFVTIPLILYLGIIQPIESFNLIDYFWIPSVVIFLYALLYAKKIALTYQIIKAEKLK